MISVNEYQHGRSKCLNISCISEARFFDETDSPYNREFGALSEYFKFHKTLISSTRVREINY